MEILIVEDDFILRGLLQMKLESWGHKVKIAENGIDALSLIETGGADIDLIILDWMMPLMDGLELCRKIRAIEKGYIYIVFLTGRDKKEDVIRGIEAGADDYITKPVEWDELKVRIRAGERIVNLVANINRLSGILPICSACKRIRDDEGYWEQMESFVSRHSEAEFSHCYCPDCAKKIYPELFREKKS